jgi:hypothetical protein
MHCFRTGVEKGIKLGTAVEGGCGYKDTLGTHRCFAQLAKYFTVCIIYQPPLYFYQSLTSCSTTGLVAGNSMMFFTEILDCQYCKYENTVL